MTNLPSALMQKERSVYVAAIVLSLILSAWGGYSHQVPNPDAFYYLRAAELFHSGQWQQGFALYRWPFYGLTIAAFMALTGGTAQIAALVVNALLDCATVAIFIALAGRLAFDGKPKFIVGWAACIIVLHPKFVVLRPMVIRDHGFYTFFLLALYFVVRDHQCARRWLKPSIACSIAAAALFRLEALLLAVVVPAFYAFSAPSAVLRKLLAVSFILVAGLLFVLLYAFWSSGILMGAGAESREVDLLARVRDLAALFNAKAAQLAQVVPPLRNAGIVAYVGFATVALLDALLRAVTIPLAILSVLAFTPRRLLSEFASRFVLWFSGWQVAMLLAFVLVVFFIDWRFAMALSLVMAIPATFTVAEVFRLWRMRLGYRLLFPVVLLAILVPWILELQRSSNLEHLRSAGYWINRHLPPSAKVLTNDMRIAYFSGRALETEIMVHPAADTPDRTLAEADYVAIEVTRNTLPPFVTRELQTRLIAGFEGAVNRRVFIYKTR
jgi:hypothetical protein